MDTPSTADRLARIRQLEEQRAVTAAEQAREVAALMAETRAAVEAAIAAGPEPGVGTRRRRQHAIRQCVADIAVARRMGRAEARRYVTWAEQAPVDTPATFARVEAGQVSERRARIVFDRVTPLEKSDDRRLVDHGIAAHLGDDHGWGDKRVESETVRAVQTLDPRGACDRAAYAASQRRVTARPAPETMGWLTTLAPMPQVVACRKALEDAATAAISGGDPRTRGEVMADTLVECVTGQATATEVPLAVQLVITDRTLLGASDLPARLADGTPVPAALARAMVLDTDAAVRVPRLFCDPMGRLVTAETDSRAFTKAMAEFIGLRDGGTCTEPWCDAPIRHIDHIEPASRGGRTALTNGRGTCAWCNLTKSDQPPADHRPQPPPTTPNTPRPPDRADPTRPATPATPRRPGPARPHHRRRHRTRVQSRAARLINTARRDQRRRDRRGFELRRPRGEIVVDLARHR